jgi:hypothetical protein
MFVFDTETRTNATQTLIFGSYRYIVGGRCLEEGLFHADDVTDFERRMLKTYVEAHRADTVREGKPDLRILSVAQFVDRLYRAAYKGRCLLVGFNLPFDLARVARNFTTARGRFAGGFSLELWSYIDQFGNERHNPYRPRIAIKHIDSKRALKGFTGSYNPDSVDLIPVNGEQSNSRFFRGHFLDLRTLAFALTDRGHSLESACKTFGVEHGKQSTRQHGVLSVEYIDYNRRDVLATVELALKLLEEYERHPISLQSTKAYSPASTGKAYLRTMGIRPILERLPTFPKEYLGYAKTAFFGGRTSAHIRKVPVPVVYTDFTSMYPTVNSLMGLWRFVISKKIKIVEHRADEMQTLLKNIDINKLFLPNTWKHMAGFVKILPDRDILPSRSKYNRESNDWQIAVNYLSADSEKPQHALWFSLPDVIVSVILTGKIPNIIDAFRMEALGTDPGLEPTRLRGAIDIDPREQDFFRVAIEERKRLDNREMPVSEKDRLNKDLKVLANSASYGIYAEMNRQESDEETRIRCYGIDPEPYFCRVAHPEVPGEFCFPPLASLITGGARLMLALLEHSLSDLGGTYAMEDTDSMAIVATEDGGVIACPGGAHRTEDGRPGILALTWSQVWGIAKRFEALNPYDREAVPGSILKIEGDNFDPNTGKQRQLYCFAISAKRYALFLKDKRGTPVLLRKGHNNNNDRWSEHGLGHLLNPTDPDSDDREWIAQVWLSIIRRALGLCTVELSFANLPAVGRITVSSPAVMRPLSGFNAGKKYASQIKPFNFLLTCHVKPTGHPIGVDPEHFHLIAPYQPDSRCWLKLRWIDQYTGKEYRITTENAHAQRQTACVKTYEEVVREYEYHAESKCADADGAPSVKQTVGPMRRRHVFIDGIRCIGKESNHLEDVDAGLIHSEHSVYTEYPDPARDEWTMVILPGLKELPLEVLIAKSGLSRRALLDIRAGRSRPHRKNQERLLAVLREETREPGPVVSDG